MTSLLDTPLVRPGIGQGLKDVFHRRYLLKLLVRKEIKLRYRGSVLGVIWSYVKPAIQFVSPGTSCGSWPAPCTCSPALC